MGQLSPKSSPKLSPKLAPIAAVEEAKNRKKDKKKKAEERAAKGSGTPFKRVDDDAWRATITDSRLLDNTHQAKNKYGGKVGDSWGDAAAADMIKVKGKGFRKEMAKKKRASWRGGGEIDQGTNSVKFSDWDSDDEE